MKVVEESKCFGGYYQKWEHESICNNCTMNFTVYLPPGAKNSPKKFPTLYFLSGLTSDENTFITKAGACERASELGLVLICPDTSPRGTNLPGEHDSENLGSGAGFYVDATQPNWKEHYHMRTYITKELPQLVNEHLPVDTSKISIFGHSMGGHGALTIGMKNQDRYKSISAFAPVCHPTQTSWGQNFFKSYLGDNEEDWMEYDAVELLKKIRKDIYLPIFVQTGTADDKEPILSTSDFINAIPDSLKDKIIVDMLEGYDHTFWFIQTFIKDHLDFHAKYLL